MNVLVNALNLRAGVVDGAATFTLNVLRGLESVRPEWTLTVVAPPGERRPATAAPGANVIAVRTGGAARRVAVEVLGLRNAVHAARPDVYLAPYESLPFALDVPVVVVAQNLAYHGASPHGVSLRLRRWYYRARMPRAYRRASRVVAVSTHVASVLHREAGLDLDRTVVSLEGSDSFLLPPPGDVRGPREPVLLVVGALAPHKDLERTLRLMKRISTPRPDLRLVLAGPETAGYGRVLRSLTERHGLEELVDYLGPVSPDRLGSLYATSTALLHLSPVEAFGLPPLEAMRYGLPVVVANRASLPEVVGDAALVVEPDDPAADDRVVSLLESPAQQEAVLTRGLARAAELTWARASDVVARAIEDAAESR